MTGFLAMTCTRLMDPLLAAVAADFRMSVPAVSVVIAAYTLPYALNQLLLGPLADRFGKLHVMLAAISLFALFTGLCATATSLPMLMLLRAFSGAASAGLIPVAISYIGDAVSYETRQVTLSRYLTGSVTGLTLAGPIGGIISEFLGWRMAFVLLSVAAAGVTGLLAVRLRHLPDPRQEGKLFNAGHYLNLAGRTPSRLFLLATAAEGAVTTGAFPFVAPFLHKHFSLSYGAVGLILAFFGGGAFLYTRLATKLLPRMGELRFILTGGCMMTVCLVLATLLRSWGGFIAVEAGLGLGYYLLHGVMQTRATELLPNARSTAMSSFAFMLFLGQSVGSLAFAMWVALFGYRWALLTDAALLLLLTLALRHIVACAATAAQARPRGGSGSMRTKPPSSSHANARSRPFK